MLGKASIHVSKIGIYMYKKKAMNTEQTLGKPVFKTGFCGFKLDCFHCPVLFGTNCEVACSLIVPA